MGKSGWTVLALAMASALACTAHTGRIAEAAAEGGQDIRPTVRAFAEPAARDTVQSLASGYWKAARTTRGDVRDAALAQIEMLLHMPPAQRWSAAAALLSAGALAEEKGLAAMGRRGAALAGLASDALAEIESGPPLELTPDRAHAKLRLGVDERRRGVVVSLSKERVLNASGFALCQGRFAWLSRDAQGRAVAAGIVDPFAAGEPMTIPAGRMILRAMDSGCDGEPDLSFALLAPSVPAPEEGGLIESDSRVALTMGAGETRRFRVPNEAGVVYRAHTEDLAHGVDTALALVDKDGRRRGRNDDGYGELGSRLFWIGDGSELELEVETPRGAGGTFKLALRTESQQELTVAGIEASSHPDGQWYRYQATSAGWHRIELAPVDAIDPILAAYTPGHAEPLVVDDDSGRNLGSAMALWLAEGETAWLLAGTQAEEGTYRLSVRPPPPFDILHIGDDGLAEAGALSEVPMVAMPADGEINFPVKAGDVLLVGGRTEAITVTMAGLAPVFLGEHALVMHESGQRHPRRVSVTCWRAEGDGLLRVSAAPGEPAGIARSIPGSGLCPQNRPLAAQAPATAGRSRLDAMPVALQSTMTVNVPAGAAEAWLKLSGSHRVADSQGMLLSLRKPGAIVPPVGVRARVIDGQSGDEVPLGEGCGLTMQTLEPGREYWIELRADGPALPEQVVLDLRSPSGHNGLKVGSRVRVHRHYVREGSSNWASGMEQYVGKSATVIELVEGSPGEALVRLDIDDGQYVWRSESLVPVGI